MYAMRLLRNWAIASKPSQKNCQSEWPASKLKSTQKQLDKLKSELAAAKPDQLLGQAESVGTFKVLVAR